jgi:sugar/nucleoside kinase (ribokinase family)
VFANLDEATALGVLDGRPRWTTVVKRGPDPALILTAGGERREVAAPVVDGVRDTTGAGDAFAGGFLTAHAAGLELVEACAAGHAAAASVLRHAGAR